MTTEPDLSVSDDADAIAACAVRPSWLSHDGQHYTSRKRLPEGIPCRLIERVGKQAAGRLLDGRTWDQMPGATTPAQRAKEPVANIDAAPGAAAIPEVV